MKFRAFFYVLFFAFLFRPTLSSALSCPENQLIIRALFTEHYVYRRMNDTIAENAIERLFNSLDSAKLYFFQEDLEKFKKAYQPFVAKRLSTKYCQNYDLMISSIASLYNKRFMTFHKIAVDLIEKMDFDYTQEDSLKVKRKELPYAKNQEEQVDRWRKWVKYQLLQLIKATNQKFLAKEKLLKRYEMILNKHNKLKTDKIYHHFLSGIAMSLDPHTDYLPPSDLADFRIKTGKSLQGIGAALRSEDGFTVITEIIPGGPADKSGLLRAEDKITAVTDEDGKTTDVIEMDLEDVVNLIRGPKGTKITLTIVRKTNEGSKRLDPIELVRDEIELQDSRVKGEIFETTYQVETKDKKKDDKEKTSKNGKKKTKKELKKIRIGVIDLPAFYIDFKAQASGKKDFPSSARDLRKEIERLKKEGMDALVIDLRSNSGGSLTESIDITGMFIDKGPVVQIKDTQQNITVSSDTEKGTVYDGPLALLISRQSASASEILAGAIQDYNRGLVLGDGHTFGKGTVQNLQDFGKHSGALKVTVSKFYRPSGASTQQHGVVADIKFKSILSQIEIGEKYQPNSLKWDTIKSAKFKKLNLVKPYLANLKKRSEKRQDTLEEFKELDEEIKKWQENKEKQEYIDLKDEAVAKFFAKEKDPEKPSKDEKDEKTEKTAEKKDDKAKEKAPPKRRNPNSRFQIEDDVHLQEALRITSDYVELMSEKDLSAAPIILGMQADEEEKPKKDKS